MALSSKAVTVFATLEALRDNQPDIRYPLATLFEPDLAKFNGGVFDPQALSNEINQQYHLGITADVLEGFAPIFTQRGWLEKVVDSERGVGYLVQCPPASQVPKELDDFNNAAQQIAEEYREFIRTLSPLSQVDRTDAELIDSLVDWLMLLDRSGENAIQNATTHYKIGKKLVLSVADAQEGGAPSEDTFLAARYVEHLFSTNSSHVPFLIELSEVGLVTEVVRDFQRPSSHIEKTNLAIYLDAPVAMDYLGLSGKPQQESVALMLDGLKQAGGSLRIFRESVTELQTSLHALLARSSPERTGPTADALRRREVFEPFVREVGAHPDKYLAAQGVGVIDETLEMYPNQHKFFTRDAYEHLYSQIGWVKEDAARHHDALIATLAFRKRTGHRTSDLFEARHVVVTRNPSFPNLARRIAKQHQFINDTHVGPVIHSRQLATAIWLRLGSRKKADIPRSYILSACRRVLTLRKNIVEKVNEFKATLSPDQAEQLEILMTSDRSTQVLMDRTLGSSNVIDAKSMPTLLEEMKKAQIAEYAAERDAELAAVSREAAQREAALTQRVEEEVKRAEGAESKVSVGERKLSDVYVRVVERANAKMTQRRLVVVGITTAFAALAAAVGFFAAGFTPIWSAVALVAIVLIAIVLNLVSSLKDAVIDPWFRRADDNILGTTALDFGLTYDEIHPLVVHEGHRFRMR